MKEQLGAPSSPPAEEGWKRTRTAGVRYRVRVSLPFVVGSKNPLDRVRVGLTKGLEVAADEELVARGGELEATVAAKNPKGLGVLEVGLVCTETYEVSGEDGSGLSWGTAYESWTPLEPGTPRQTVRLRVPADGPYSYIGSVLSFRWEVVARGVRKRRVDARATFDLEVRP